MEGVRAWTRTKYSENQRNRKREEPRSEDREIYRGWEKGAEKRGKMGRRRTLINGFGANWATRRVSVKNARLPNEHDGNSNCRSVIHRLCAIVLVTNNPRFEYSRENHCIISYTRFVLRLSPPPFFFCFSVSLVFSSVPIFPCSCWFLPHFFGFPACTKCDARWLTANATGKKGLVWCRVNDVIAVESNFASANKKKKRD